MYKLLIRPIFFLFDPEKVHGWSFGILKKWLSWSAAAKWTEKQLRVVDADLELELFGLKFKNPVGLAAGFDKNARLGHLWGHLGFGFVELGTVTPRPQAGNPRKRLFRLPKSKAIINRMGFNNDGVEVLAARLKALPKTDTIIGVNIGKNKDTPNEKAADDYVICFEKLFPYVDYFVVNVSSPNTPGLRALQEKEPLLRLLQSLQKLNQAKAKPKPLLLKIAPDLSFEQLDEVVEVCIESQLDGLIANNTTISREDLSYSAKEIESIGAGGLSGQPLRERSEEVLRYLVSKSEGKFPVIGVGGIMQPQDAVQRLESGAALIQIFSGFIYEGPAFVAQICRAIIKAQKKG